MGTHTGSVMTLANSIIGVSVLAMPFCFKQCGIILSIVMLILSNVVTRLACYYLIKSAIMEKRKNFEMLAFRVLGRSGKLIVELCIIGFMLGTCVAFFVVVGDLGPTILAEVIGIEHPHALRPSVLIGLGVFVVLPLGLLRNVESLSTLCAASIAFYFCLVLKVMGEATSHLIAGDWLDKVSFWRPAGVLQCIPIFSMALSCQTQLFEVFDSLPSTPMERMNSIIRSAINMTTTFYIAVGFFGYVAFCNQPFSGNLLINLSPSVVSYVIKLGFVLSVAVSFPLVIFPCRASIYSLIFTSGTLSSNIEGSSNIPETKFQCITLLIVTLSLITGLLVPSIEAVLGFVGSTIGVFVCIILPSIIFVCLSKKNTSERLLAKVLAGMGLLTMVLSTYANLTAVETQNLSVQPDIVKVNVLPVLEEKVNVEQAIRLPDKLLDQELPKNLEVKEEDMEKLKHVGDLKNLVLPKLKQVKEIQQPLDDKPQQAIEKKRQEPPNPVPVEPKVPMKKKKSVLVPPLIKDDIKQIKKIDIEEIKRKIEKLDLPKSVEVEKVDDKVNNSNDNKNLEEIKNNTVNVKKEVNNNLIQNEIIKKANIADNIAIRLPLPLVVKSTLKNNAKDREKRDTLYELNENVNEASNSSNIVGNKIIDDSNRNNINHEERIIKGGDVENKIIKDENKVIRENNGKKIDEVEVVNVNSKYESKENMVINKNKISVKNHENKIIEENKEDKVVRAINDENMMIKENIDEFVINASHDHIIVKDRANNVQSKYDDSSKVLNGEKGLNEGKDAVENKDKIEIGVEKNEEEGSFVKEVSKVNNGEKCLKNNRNVVGSDTIDVEVVTPLSIDDNLIKTPAYLSDPQIILDANKKLDSADSSPGIESVPHKRDLKSVDENVEKIEHR